MSTSLHVSFDRPLSGSYSSCTSWPHCTQCRGCGPHRTGWHWPWACCQWRYAQRFFGVTCSSSSNSWMPRPIFARKVAYPRHGRPTRFGFRTFLSNWQTVEADKSCEWQHLWEQGGGGGRAPMWQNFLAMLQLKIGRKMQFSTFQAGADFWSTYIDACCSTIRTLDLIALGSFYIPPATPWGYKITPSAVKS